MDGAFDATHYFELSDEERQALVAKVAEHLGAGWRAEGACLVFRGGDGEEARFAFVPGGWLRMGFSPDDVFGLCGARKSSPLADDCTWREEIAWARPSEWVRIEPLAVAVVPELASEPEAARAMTEAELEWVLSDCGRRRWVGVEGELTTRNRWKAAKKVRAPFDLERVFDGAQECGETWGEGRWRGLPITREVHYAWQDDDEEIIAAHAAHRSGGRGVERMVLPLGSLSQSAPPTDPPEVSAATALDEALSKKKGKAKKLAWYAMDLLAGSPGPDLLPLIETIVERLGRGADDRRWLRDALQWLGTVGWGPGARALHGVPDHEVANSIAEASLDSLLEHEDASVRAAAVAPSALDPTCAAGLTELFAEEAQPRVTAAIVVGLALVDAPAPAPHPKHEKKLAGVRLLASAIRGEASYDDAMACLGDRLVSKLPWFEGSVVSAFIVMIRRGTSGPEELAEAAERLLSAGPRSGTAWWHHQRAVAGLAFGPLDRGPDRLLDPHALGPAHHRLLEHFFAHRGRGLLPPGTRRSELCRIMLVGEETESPFAQEVDLDGERLPLYFALHETFARVVEDGYDPSAHEVRVDALFGGGLDDVLALTRAAWREANHDLVERGRNRFEPPPIRPWPYVSERYYRRVRRASADERAALRRRCRAEILDEAEESTPIAAPLALLAAATEPPDTIDEDVCARVDMEDLFTIANDGPRSRWLLDAFGPGWIERRIVDWMGPVIEDLLGGGEGEGALVRCPVTRLIEPTWSTPALASLVARDFVPRVGDSAYATIVDDPELAPLLERLPQSVHALYDGGDRTWRGALAPAKRDPVLRDLVELIER